MTTLRPLSALVAATLLLAAGCGLVAATLLLAAGCGNDDAPSSDAGPTDASPDGRPDDELGLKRGPLAFRLHIIPARGEYEGKETTALLACGSGAPIVNVPPEFAAAIDEALMGKLADGRAVIPGPEGDCYQVLGPEAPWGIGSRDRPLEPFRSFSAAVRTADVDDWLWIPSLDGVDVIGGEQGFGYQHDGCVRFDDERPALGEDVLSLYAGLAAWAAALDLAMDDTVDAYQDSPQCFGRED